MARRTATVLSIDSIRQLKVALDKFAHDVEEATVLLQLECGRPVEWIEHDRAAYWPRELRKASDGLSEARLALERCELSGSSDERRSCYEERVGLDKAKRRMRLCEEKVEAVRRWRPKLRKEIEEFKVQLARMRNYLESDQPRATAALERMAAALDQYVQQRGPAADADSTDSADVSSALSTTPELSTDPAASADSAGAQARPETDP